MRKQGQQPGHRRDALEATLPRAERPQALVVVQDERLRQQIAKQCERCRFRVVATRTSNELLSLMASSLMGIREPDPFRLFVIDSWTQDYHALRILRGIRSSGWQAPAIILVDPQESNPQQELLELHVTIVLSKPVGPEEISAAVHSCVEALTLQAGSATGVPVLYI